MTPGDGRNSKRVTLKLIDERRVEQNSKVTIQVWKMIFVSRWWFHFFVNFLLQPYLGKIPILTHIFQRG